MNWSIIVFTLSFTIFISAEVRANCAFNTQSAPNTFSGEYTFLEGEGCPLGTEPTFSSDESFEHQIVLLLNTLRVSNGLPPLKISNELTASARYHAKDMCQKNYFAHASQDGSGNVTCQSFSRIGSFYSWTAAAENIAAGYFDAQSAFNGWVNSPGHYSNMMSPMVYEVGIGYYYDASSSYVTRWVMDLGRRSNVYPIIINQEEEVVSSQEIDLYKYTASGYNEVRFKINNGSWNSWQPISNNLLLNTNATSSGNYTLYADMRNAAGNILSSSDDVILEVAEGSGPTTASNGIVIKVKVALQGSYNAANQSMSTNLRNNNLIPLNQPYNRAPWNYAGTESVSSLSAIPTNVVDWVLLEARSAVDNYTVLETKAAFLLSNGSVVDVNGSTEGVTFSQLTNNAAYFVSIKTRNHLAVLSANTISVPNTTVLDFTNPTNILGGASQLSNMGNGSYTLLAGDMDANGTITVSDFNFFQSEMSLINAYVDSDCNMDKNVTVADLNLYSPNMSKIGVTQIRY